MRTKPLQENCNRFRQRQEMDTQTPKATGSKAARLRAAGHGYSTTSTDTLIADGAIDRSSSTWHRPLVSRDVPLVENRFIEEHSSRTDAGDAQNSRSTYPPPPTAPTPPIISPYLDFPEELSQMLINERHLENSDELAEAFREASIYPPITKQSLSELDIQNIITNIRLRHDVNFDRDLSFRPNLDGARGQAKQRKTDMYWAALVAELELYNILSRGPPSPTMQAETHWMALANHARRRIPIMFQTIQDVLKSLVPDRDHSRVDEHLDVPMLMQEIERGVCDLVRLAEWMAQLLKEHCAPMRDGWVDKMVNLTREGVAKGSSKDIVDGLRELLGILETMKLVSRLLACLGSPLILLQDVANHQIRNLKTLLIEDTINFEKHYHLDRLVSHRSRVDLDYAHAYYVNAKWEFVAQHPNQTINTPHVRLEIFTRAVIATFFNKNGRHEFPDTFYLDQDRLRTLKWEIEDLIHLEVCMDAFVAFLKDFGHDGPIPPPTRHQLQTSLLAIMGDALGYGSNQWFINSEALSLELLRQASHVTGQAVSYSHQNLSLANDKLRSMFCESFSTHNPRLETVLLDRVIPCMVRNTNSTPMDLFNNLVPVAKTVSPSPTHFIHLQSNDTSSSPHTLDPESARWQDIANRITHIILLHWRVWDRIAYVQEDEAELSQLATAANSSAPSAQSTQLSASCAPEQDTQVVAAMKTGEPRESATDTHVAHETSSQ